MRILPFALLASFGCTHWATTDQYGPPREVGRRMRGGPQVEEITTAGIAGGLGSSSLVGAGAMVKRTHCVQQAEVDYVQPFTVTAEIHGRTADVIGGILVGLVGLGTITSANRNYNDDVAYYNANLLSQPPAQPTGAYIGGAVIGVAGLAWLGWSLFVAPRGPRPVEGPQERRYTELQYVESSGCGLVPGDVRPLPPAPPAP